jgi:hypothetical protein
MEMADGADASERRPYLGVPTWASLREKAATGWGGGGRFTNGGHGGPPSIYFRRPCGRWRCRGAF